MAVGRVGGTKAKLTGKVGQTIYQIKRNDDGSYSQIIYEKGVTTVNRTTPRLQVQRMCTAMVECMMKQLKKVAQISMQAARNKTISLNAFSSYNLMLLAQDVKSHWNGNNEYVYPVFSSSGYLKSDLGGRYMLSSGSLPFNLFEAYYIAGGEWGTWPKFNQNINECAILYWNRKSGVNTVGEFFKSYGITRLDTIVFCAFLYHQITDEDEGTFEEVEKHLYVILKPNPRVPDTTPLNYNTWPYVFDFESNGEPIFDIQGRTGRLGVGFASNNYQDVSVFGYIGGFSISYRTGKKLISSCRYIDTVYGGGNWLDGQAPYQVFGSWMGEPNNSNWPSPY